MKVWITYKQHWGSPLKAPRADETRFFSNVVVFVEEMAAYRYAVEHGSKVHEMDFTDGDVEGRVLGEQSEPVREQPG